MLAKRAQDDFSAGGHPFLAPERVPSIGFGDGINALIGDDGLLYRRGGTILKSTADLISLLDASVSGARFLWDGHLVGGPRTVVAGKWNFSVLQADDVTPQTIHGVNTDGDLTTTPPVTPYPTKAAFVNGVLVLPNGFVYGGSRKTAAYSAGTVSVTPGSTNVVGVGTSWLANVDKGMIFGIGTGGPFFAVAAVVSNTVLTLASPWPADAGALAGAAYILGHVQNLVSVGNDHAPLFAGAADKLLVLYGNRLYVGRTGMIEHGSAFNDFHDFPEGSQLLGAEQVRDQTLVFTTAGVWALSGIALDLTDPDGNVQRRLEQISRDVVLWSWAGVANYGGQLVVPAVDGVYLMDAVSAPRLIIGGFAALYRSYVDAGYHTGGAVVYRDHYILPILDAANVIVDQLVCRLTPTLRGRGNIAYGWTRGDGAGAKMAALAVRVATTAAREPVLLGGHAVTGRIVVLDYFEPALNVSLGVGKTYRATDFDGTAHVMEIVTREYPAGGPVTALVRRLVARYELVDPSTVNPTLALAYSIDGGAWVTVTGSAPEGTLADPAYPWKINKRAHGIRFRIRTSGAISNFILHMLEIAVRPSGKAVK